MLYSILLLLIVWYACMDGVIGVFCSSSHSLIVLDDVHRLVEYVQVGDRVSVSHSLMHALSTLLSYSMSSG